MFIVKIFFLFVFFLISWDVQATCLRRSSPVPQNFIGLQLAHAERDIGWKIVRDLKLDWVKVVVYWDMTESQKDHFDWRWSDAAFAQIRRHGNVKIHLLINDTPKWLEDRRLLVPYYKRYLSLFLDRYKNDLKYIHAIEIFNEPNYLGYGWLSNIRSKNKLEVPLEESAELFAEVLKVSNEMIRPVAPNVILVSGGVTSLTNAGSYIQEMFRHDIADCIDVFGYHPYEYHNRLVEVQGAIQTFLNQIGVRDMPVWYTEYGVTDNRKRAEYIQEIFEARPRMNALFLFTDQDFGLFDNTFGLVDYIGAKKPEYNLFKAEMQKIHDAKK